MPEFTCLGQILPMLRNSWRKIVTGPSKHLDENTPGIFLMQIYDKRMPKMKLMNSEIKIALERKNEISIN